MLLCANLLNEKPHRHRFPTHPAWLNIIHAHAPVQVWKVENKARKLLHNARRQHRCTPGGLNRLLLTDILCFADHGRHGRLQAGRVLRRSFGPRLCAKQNGSAPKPDLSPSSYIAKRNICNKLATISEAEFEQSALVPETATVAVPWACFGTKTPVDTLFDEKHHQPHHNRHH